jgi:DNA polymerase (family 10)
LERLDIVLGCFHSSLRKKEDQTARYLAALRNPSIHVLGHPRGRIYNFRLGLSAEWPRVFDLAAKLDKAVEIDCYPEPAGFEHEASASGEKIGLPYFLGHRFAWAIATTLYRAGVGVRLLAGVPQERILNFMSREELLTWASSVRGAANAK